MSLLIDGSLEFIHIPKTAGKWIELVCGYLAFPVGSRHDYGSRLAPTFAVARAPYLWMRSAHAYLKTRHHLATKTGFKGWFHDNAYRKIGTLKSLGNPNAPLDDVLDEYLRRMPGEYSAATLGWLIAADKLVDMLYLHRDLKELFAPLEHGDVLLQRMASIHPYNVSDNKSDVEDPDWIDRLILKEKAYYQHVLPRGVSHD